MTKKIITVSTIMNVPIETAWKYYTEPEHIMQWYSASKDWHTPSATNDFAVKGKFSYRMEAKDGSFGFDFSGVYTNIKTNELIAYTMDDERKATVFFSPNGDYTKITIEFEAETENTIELQQAGWQAILDSFKIYAEASSLTN